MKTIFTTIILIATLQSPIFAQSRNQALREIRDLAVQIENATFNTRSDSRSLSMARSYMARALSELNGSNGNGDALKCRNYAQPILDRTMPSGDAMDEAIRICQTVLAYDEMVFMNENLDRVLSSREAITRAAQYADQNLRGKLDLLEFAYSKYNRIRSTTDAIAMSVRAISPINNNRAPGGTLSCFKKTYPLYDRTLPADEAMDRTATACQ